MVKHSNISVTKVKNDVVIRMLSQMLWIIIGLFTVIIVLAGVIPRFGTINRSIITIIISSVSILLLLYVSYKGYKSGEFSVPYTGLESYLMLLTLVFLISTASSSSFWHSIFGFDWSWISFWNILMLVLLTGLMVYLIRTPRSGVALFWIISFGVVLALLLYVSSMNGWLDSIKKITGNVIVPFQSAGMFYFVLWIVSVSFLYISLAHVYSVIINIVIVITSGVLSAVSMLGLINVVDMNNGWMSDRILLLLLWIVTFVLIMVNALRIVKSNVSRLLYILFWIVLCIVLVWVFNSKIWGFGWISLHDGITIVVRSLSQSSWKLLFGNGPGTAVISFRQYMSVEVANWIYGNNVVIDTILENIFPFGVLLFGEVGIVGLVVVSLLAYRIVRTVIKAITPSVVSEYSVIFNVVKGLVLSMMLGFVFLPVTLSAVVWFILLLVIFYNLLNTIYPRNIGTLSLNIALTVSKKDDREYRIGFIAPLFLLILIAVGLWQMGIRTYDVYATTRATMYFSRDEQSKALKYANLAVKYGGSANSYIMRASVLSSLLLKNDKLNENEKKTLLNTVLNDIKKAQEKGFYDSRIWGVSAALYNSLNKPAQGAYSQLVMDSYTNAIRLEPMFAQYRINLGDELVQVQQYTDALNMYKSVLNIKRMDVLLRFSVGYRIVNVYVLQGQYDMAQQFVMEMQDEVQSYMQSNNDERILNILRQLQEKLSALATTIEQSKEQN